MRKNLKSNKEENKIDINEFVNFGYLQELNRQFLHPLGMSMELDVGDNRWEIKIAHIRKNELSKMNNIDSDEYERRKKNVENQKKKIATIRKKELGFVIQGEEKKKKEKE